MKLFEMFGEEDPYAPYEKEGAKKRIPAIKSKLASYIQSPTYKKRLETQGVKNPDKVIKDRLQKLGEVEVSQGMSPSLAYIFTGPNQKERKPALTVKGKDSEYTMMHELSHTTNYGDIFFDPNKNKYGKNIGDANTASGKGMSQNEMMFLVNKSTLPDKVKKEIAGRAKEGAEKWGTFQNPTEGMAGEAHSFDPSEFKSDLDAVRLLFNDYGITQKFGQDIDEATIEKALKNPKVANEPHFQRLLKNFGKKNIIEINNKVAKGGLANAVMSNMV